MQNPLAKELELGRVRLELFGEQHVEGLREACAKDPEIWQIYPVNMLGEDFDKAIEIFHGMSDWVRFAAIDKEQDKVVGATNYISPNMYGVVEIGGTYIEPSVRGTGFNRAMKKLLIEHAFACGIHKIEFSIDTRNERSMAAVLKLGATKEGVLRQNRVTWTGYRRDTAVFGLLRDEWAG